jgi:homocysteine S-methyltransferase
LLTRYYDGYAAIAAQAAVGLLLEAPTWRADPDGAAKVGYDLAALDRVNRASVELMQGLRERYELELGLTDVQVGGMTGPRGDGYVAGEDADPDEAAEYHAHQARAQAAAGADLMTALTFTGAGEAIGFVRAVRASARTSPTCGSSAAAAAPTAATSPLCGESEALLTQRDRSGHSTPGGR